MYATRRDLLALAARAALLPGAAEFLAAWSHSGMTAPPQPPLTYRPQFFDAEDFGALQAFTEILIPTDNTPGAREAHCAHYIDFLLHAADAVPELQAQWREALRKLRQMGFHAAEGPARAQLVESMSRTDDPVFRAIKQLNTFAFYTSRAGMIETLDYRGNTFNATFPACTHPEHRQI